MTKITKVEAVYLTVDQVGGPDLGTRCGKCRDFIQLTSECTITIDSKVSGARGTCTQYIYGNPQKYGIPRLLISKSAVGYIEGREIPTYCGRCEYYGGTKYEGPCARVEGDVEYGGCCNLYQAG